MSKVYYSLIWRCIFLIVIAGPSSQILGIKTAKLLGAKLLPLDFRTFPEGTSYVRVDGDVSGEHVVIIHSTYPNQNERLMQLYLMLDAVRDMNAKKVTLVVPYFAYARQHRRFKPGEAISAKTIAQILQSLGADEIFVVNIHNIEALSYFSIPAENLNAMTVIGEYLKGLELEDPMVVAPDDGAIGLAETVGRILNAPYINFEKHRDFETNAIVMEGKELDLKGRDVAIVDDMIATGGTMAEAISIVKKQGARHVYAAAVHPLLIGNARFKLLTAGAEAIIATDTIPSDVTTVTVSKLIADALARS